MSYSDKVLDHYENPRNVGKLNKDDPDVGTGLVGAPACGDVMKLQILVKDGIIEDAKFKTFGCGSAIASSSLITEMVKGKSLEQALEIKNTQVVQELNLPPVKIHCSVLAEDAVKAAVNDYLNKRKIDMPKVKGVEYLVIMKAPPLDEADLKMGESPEKDRQEMYAWDDLKKSVEKSLTDMNAGEHPVWQPESHAWRCNLTDEQIEEAKGLEGVDTVTKVT